ncbi:MAG: TROVE domain-containing protein [Anaerolineae bacterium]|nr:TROVE domain-containing protein [Anaerolineae bacterium]
MTRILDRFNLKRNPYARANGLNPEGFPSFTRSLEEAYIQVLLTNTLTGTFYATESQLLDESLKLHAEIALTDPAFMARAIVYARRQGLMRLQPVVGLAYLAKADLALFHRVFPEVILTPGDLTSFVEIVRGGVVPGGMGRSIKKAINGWINGLSEYHAIKYGTGGQGYSLRDVLRLTHPKPPTETQDAIFHWLADRETWLEAEGKHALTPQIDAFERLKQAGGNGDQVEARQLIEEGRLPYEVVTGVIGLDFETWRALMQQMPYFALLRHLNTLQRAGVLKHIDSAKYVAGRLNNADALRKARVLPFRLYMAYRMFDPRNRAERKVADALVEALEASFANMPELGGEVAIAPDVSGSMSGGIAGQRGKTRYIDIAGIFTAALLKASGGAIILPFETDVVKIKLSAHDSAMTTADRLAKIGGGGTAVSAPVSYLLDKRIRVDTFIGITDNIEWARDQSGRHGFLPTTSTGRRSRRTRRRS